MIRQAALAKVVKRGELLYHPALNRLAIEALLHHPEIGIMRIPVNTLRFGSTLPYIRNKQGLHYHPDHFFIDLQHSHLWVRAGVEINNGGWYWKNDVFKRYEDLGIETTMDLLQVLSQYIPIVRHLLAG